MTQETAPHVAAVYDWGRWTAQCPTCGTGFEVGLGQQQVVCQYQTPDGPAGDGTVTIIDWPNNAEQIVAELANLPEARRHWAPPPVPADSPDPATATAAAQYAEAGLTDSQIATELATPGDQRRVWIDDGTGAPALEER
jgi:hypothetical protein